MADYRRCTYSGGTHPQCAACHNFVYSKSEHIHVYRRNPYREDVVCGECYALACCAAVPVLQAAEGIGLKVDADGLREAMATGKILVLVQTQMGFSLN